MIVIDRDLCDGCGACLDACPTGAIYLVDGKAALDPSLCRECEACLAVCPNAAITCVSGEQAVEPVATTVPGAETAVIRVQPQALREPLPRRALPLLGAALTWAGREIVPRLAPYLLRIIERRTPESKPTSDRGTEQTSSAREHGRHRQRHRGSGK